MVYGIYQSAAGMIVNQYRQSVLANNLANLDTVGFKSDLTAVRERKVEARANPAGASRSDRILDRMTGGLLVAPTYTSFEQGHIEFTEGKLDIAIDGDGFLAVDDGGQTRYTRDGRLAVNRDGVLVTIAGGRPVLDEQGNPISVPTDARGRLEIHAGGQVEAGGTSFGRIGMVQFADRSRLCKAGSNLFDARGAKAQAVPPQFRTNSIESSTVDPTRAMVSMIEVSRSYELNANLVSLADTTLGRAVNDIGRIR
jgi:flagellar basal-body rod protein FlgF